MKILFAALAYFMGAFPSGFLFFRAGEKKDIRSFGSGATGATNVLRLKGWKYALPVAFIDLLKGFLPAFLALKIFRDPGLAAVCASLAVLGHCFPVYIGFKGGKGVATAAGAMFAVALKPTLLSLIIFVLTVALTGFVSLASILAALSFPFFMLLFKMPANLILLSLPILLIILIRHAENIKRLIGGQERKFGQKIKVEQ
ncbi:MAG: glycerol-3-phosphate 1-O-acyltransferase PlsY [Candidatus Aminicenantes bacterium]|jgi:glycerol-3-phosphate acyltransferase PlsY|nr:glycerol-3-phosphate 1-O-acyltransferase PlsY [Candidatus Aminicenantes bacterium]